MTEFNNNTPFGQAPAFGQAPQQQPAFGQAPQQQAPAFGQAPQQPAPGFGQAPQQPAPAFGQAPAAPGSAPSFGGGTAAQTGGRKWQSVTALELQWLTPEEFALCEQYENDFNRISMELPNRFDLQVQGEVTFSALASPFLPKEDRKNNGHLWELSISIKNPRLIGTPHVFAKYVFAKRLSRNIETGEVSYRFTNEIRNTEPEMSREEVKQIAMSALTKAGKPAPAWPIALMDEKDFSKQAALTEKDFASDGSQTVTLALQIVRTQNLASVAKYAWYKPYLQGILADLDNIHWNEFKGSQFRAAQEHALEEARKAMQQGAQQEAQGFTPDAQGFSAPGQQPVAPAATGFGQAPQQAPGFATAPQQQAPAFGQAPAAPEAPAFGQAPQQQAPAFGQAPQQQPAFGQAPAAPEAPQAPQGAPFAPPFDGGGNNPFM